MVTILNSTSLAQKLLEHDFDVEEMIATDYSWEKFVTSGENRNEKMFSNEIILSLLHKNSTFPRDYEYCKASREIQEFDTFSHSGHIYIKF